jgi:NAD binding domain of 6-phosphogluconate dehydrogenase
MNVGHSANESRNHIRGVHRMWGSGGGNGNHRRNTLKPVSNPHFSFPTKVSKMSELKGDFGFIGTLFIILIFILIIGIGMMGYPMALNIRRKIPTSSKLYIYDISKTAMEKFKQEASLIGPIIITTSNKQVVDNSDTIISMLPEGKHVKEAFLTPEIGALETSSCSKKLFLDCSTIDPESSLQVNSAVIKSGKGNFSDTPVSVSFL